MSDWDLVLRGGRVIDPESGLDAARDVAVAEGRIAAVGVRLAPGRVEVDVARQVVTAGFVDLHSHVIRDGRIVADPRPGRHGSRRATLIPSARGRPVSGHPTASRFELR